jgi:hypothetical protein
MRRFRHDPHFFVDDAQIVSGWNRDNPDVALLNLL